MNVGSLVRRLIDDPYATTTDGWASTTFVSSLRRAVLVALSVWQVVMVLTVLAEPGLRVAHLLLLAGHAGLIGLALAAVTRQVLGLPVFVACYLLFLGAWAQTASVESPLLLAACWQANLAPALPAALMRGRRAPVLMAATVVLVPVSMVLLRPDSGSDLPGSVLVTGLSIFVATRGGISYVVDFVRDADTEWAAASRERETVEAHRTASRQSAEDARVLHDTVINTLAALAAGGHSTTDQEAVRRRCADDVATMEALTRSEVGTPVTGEGIREGARDHRVRVRHTGITDAADLRRREALLEPAVQAALARATTELVRNAAKHAGVDEVIVDIRTDRQALHVTVSDEGVGFDGVLVPGRGLAESVVARIADVGGTVVVDSAPTRGTRVRLSVPLDAAARRRGSADQPAVTGFARVVQRLQIQASGLFAVGLTLVGVVLSVANHQGQLNAEMPMVLVVAAVCGIGWLTRGQRGRIPGMVAATLALGAAVAFVLSAAAVDYGRTDVVRWQAICPIGPLILMLGVRAWRRWASWASGCYAAAVLGVAGWVAADTPLAALAVAVAGTAGLGLVAGWASFQRMVARLGRQAVSAAREAADLRLEAVALEAAADARRRWSSTVLEDSVELLRQIAQGQADPSRPEIQWACSEEERYLRQLTQLSPRLVRMGEWFARALAEARSRGAELTVRSGDVDVDAESAAALGDLLIRGLGGVASGKVTTTLFPTAQELRFTVVGPGPDLSRAVQDWTGPEGTSFSVRRLGPQDLAEVVWAQRPVAHGDGGVR